MALKELLITILIWILFGLLVDQGTDAESDAESRGPTWKQIRCTLNQRLNRLEKKVERASTCMAQPHRPKPPSSHKQAFHEIADLLLGTIRWDVDPCDDFYTHACGSTTKRNKPMIERASDNLRQRIKFLFEESELPEEFTTPELQNAFNHLKQLYKEGQKPLDSESNIAAIKKAVDETLGGIPLIDDGKTYEDLNIFKTSLQFKKLWDSDVIFKFSLVHDSKKTPGRNTFVFEIDDKSWRWKKWLSAVYGYAEVTGQKLKMELDEMKAVADKLKTEIASREDEIYDGYSQDREVRWEEVKEESPRLAEAVEEFVGERAMEEIAKMPIIVAGKNLSEELLKSTLGSGRRNRGVSVFMSSPEKILERLYAHHYGPNIHDGDAVLQIRRGVELIRTQLIERVFELDWLDTVSKQRVLNKLNAIVPRVAYSAWIMDNYKLSKHYEGLPELRGDESYLELLNNFAHSRYVSKTASISATVKAKADRFSDDFNMNPFVINAVYSHTENTITILQGWMATPMWNSKYPVEYQFGPLGETVGHEITHAIGTGGIEYDSRGIKQAILTNESAANFKNAEECFSDMFSNFCFHDENGGSRCIGNNAEYMLPDIIADYGGVRSAFYALKAAENRGFTFYEIPGFENRTSEQIFFYAYAAGYCEPRENYENVGNIWFGSHPPNPSRVNGTFQNFPEFAKAFNCPKDSPMRLPHKKLCPLW